MVLALKPAETPPVFFIGDLKMAYVIVDKHAPNSFLCLSGKHFFDLELIHGRDGFNRALKTIDKIFLIQIIEYAQQKLCKELDILQIEGYFHDKTRVQEKV